MMFNCYNPLGYVVPDTRTLISQRNVNYPIEMAINKDIIVNMSYNIVNLELNNIFINSEKCKYKD